MHTFVHTLRDKKLMTGHKGCIFKQAMRKEIGNLRKPSGNAGYLTEITSKLFILMSQREKQYGKISHQHEIVVLLSKH